MQHGRSYSDAPRLPEGERIDPRALFADPLLGPDALVELELGPGTGSFLLERAARPDVRILGFEIRRKWASIIDERIRKRELCKRACVFAEDARDALPRLEAGSISRIYVHFPDPWWKKRHRKRILLQPPICDEAARLLGPRGELFIQTDVEERAESYERILMQHAAFEPLLGTGARSPDPEFGARSSRERRAIEDGLPIVRLRFVKR